jgi:pimeloyl-ACP methyl ester carboxylesterase
MEFGRIHYSISSTNRPYTILFLHSFHSSAASFHHIEKHLKNQFNIVCLDFQGHGLSSHIQNEKFFSFYSVDGTAKVLLEFLNHANLTNFVIVGNSIGGNAAVRNLANLRDVKGLIASKPRQASKFLI